MANINAFKSQMTGGGVRANQFVALLHFPTWVAGGGFAFQQAQVLCKAAQLPTSTIADVPVNYRGREVHFAGERTFQPWTISIINSEVNMNIRSALEFWQAGIGHYTGSEGILNPAAYQSTLEVIQLDRNGSRGKSYRFIDAYPTDIGAIQLSYDQNNAIEEFDVTFTYNYFVSSSGTDVGGTSFSGSFGIGSNGLTGSIGASVDTQFGTLGAGLGF